MAQIIIAPLSPRIYCPGFLSEAPLVLGFPSDLQIKIGPTGKALITLLSGKILD
jgi:hypothetical protein